MDVVDRVFAPWSSAKARSSASISSKPISNHKAVSMYISSHVKCGSKSTDIFQHEGETLSESPAKKVRALLAVSQVPPHAAVL
jgi:hypothetical protein